MSATHLQHRPRRHVASAVLLAVLALAACGGEDADDDADAPASPATTQAAPAVDDVLGCLTDAGLDAERATDTERERIEVRYPLDTTEIDFLDSPADAEQEVEMGEAYDFDAFAVGAVYVLLGGLDEDALADRDTVTGCLQPR